MMLAMKLNRKMRTAPDRFLVNPISLSMYASRFHHHRPSTVVKSTAKLRMLPARSAGSAADWTAQRGKKLNLFTEEILLME